jgi:hypothetical protein
MMRNVVEEKAFTFLYLDESDSYPYTIGKNAHGLHCVNNSTSNELIITITYKNGGSLDIPVPASTALRSRYSSFTAISTSGSTDFDIGLEE